jgi:hypothetical protein
MKLIGRDDIPEPDTVGDWLRRMGDPRAGQPGLKELDFVFMMNFGRATSRRPMGRRRFIWNVRDGCLWVKGSGIIVRTVHRIRRICSIS